MSTTATRENAGLTQRGPRGRHADSSGVRQIALAKSSVLERAIGITDMSIVLNPILFLITTLVLESVQPGYDRVRDTISTLAWGEYGWAQTTVFVLIGVSLIALALRLRSIVARGRCASVGQALLALLGIGFFVIAVFPTTSPFAGPTSTSEIHRETARAISFLFPVMCFFVAQAMRSQHGLQTIRRCTVALGIMTAIMLPAGAVATFTDAPWLGGVERLILAWGLLWIEILGIGLVNTTVRGGSPPRVRQTGTSIFVNTDAYPQAERVCATMWRRNETRK